MKVEVNVNKGVLIALIGSVLLLAGIFAVYAYNSNPANPSVFGHSANEIEGVCRSDGTGCPAFNSTPSLGGFLTVCGAYSVDESKNVKIELNATSPNGVRTPFAPTGDPSKDGCVKSDAKAPAAYANGGTQCTDGAVSILTGTKESGTNTAWFICVKMI